MASSPQIRSTPEMVMSHSQTITETAEAVKRLEENFLKVNEFIDGNGKPGAKVRLAQLEANDKNICDKIDALKTSMDGLSRLAAALVATSITIVLPFAVWTFTVFIPEVLAHLGKAQP